MKVKFEFEELFNFLKTLLNIFIDSVKFTVNLRKNEIYKMFKANYKNYHHVVDVY